MFSMFIILAIVHHIASPGVTSSPAIVVVRGHQTSVRDHDGVHHLSDDASDELVPALHVEVS